MAASVKHRNRIIGEFVKEKTRIDACALQEVRIRNAIEREVRRLRLLELRAFSHGADTTPAFSLFAAAESSVGTRSRNVSYHARCSSR